MRSDKVKNRHDIKNHPLFHYVVPPHRKKSFFCKSQGLEGRSCRDPEQNTFNSVFPYKRPKWMLMNFLEKIETLINQLLLRLGELIFKAIPAPFKKFHARYQTLKASFIAFLKTLPSFLKTQLISRASQSKDAALSIKTGLTETYKNAIAEYKGMGKIKKFLLTPFLMFEQWLRGLTVNQSLLLMTFTCASILAVIGIGFSGKKLAHDHLESMREPASVLEEVGYERPEYYKKQTRFFELTSVRLPVYVAKVNEIRSVDIDFSATLTNRSSRMYLEKHEFQLRDHLVLQIEPSIASFPLEEEGKEIIRKKILLEINDFLKLHNQEGEVLELKIVYVLAN
jgi:flagellar basal body-associated protein FliL